MGPRKKGSEEKDAAAKDTEEKDAEPKVAEEIVAEPKVAEEIVAGKKFPGNRVAEKKIPDEDYERPGSGPGSQALNPSLRQTIAFGNAAWEQDDFATAYQHFRAILQDHPNFADIRNRAGLCLAMMGDSEGALQEFDKALEVNDCYAEALLNRAIVLNDLGRHDEAAECFHRASALDLRDSRVFPSHMGNQLANAHAKTGDLYMAADRPEEAATEYAAAVEIRPGFLDLQFKLAEAYMDLEMLGEARAHLTEILTANADFAGARVRLGALLLRMDDKPGARREWERCAEQSPNDRRIQAYLASLDQ